MSGIDRQKVGQVAAEMRSLRTPDPYKNKGVRYTGRAAEEEGRKDRSESERVPRRLSFVADILNDEQRR